MRTKRIFNVTFVVINSQSKMLVKGTFKQFLQGRRISNGQAFLNATILKRHVDRLHATGPKKFQCDLCPNSLVLNYALKCHKQKIHEKVVNFKCEDCGKGFFYNYENFVHVKVVHKGEKNFKCHLCDKQFVRPGYLKSHINSAH